MMNYEANMQCNVCKNRGLPESQWKSHNVRKTPHPESMVTCPTILNNKCSHCKEIGHLVSKCPVKKVEEKTAKRMMYKKRVEVLKALEPTKVVSEAPKNTFAALMDDSDSETEEYVEPVVSKKRDIRTMKWSEMVDSDSEED